MRTQRVEESSETSYSAIECFRWADADIPLFSTLFQRLENWWLSNVRTF